MLKRLFRSTPGPSANRDSEHVLNGRALPLAIRENARAKRLTLRIAPGGRGLKVTVPPGVPQREIERFLARHEGWLTERLGRLPDPTGLRPGVKVPLRGKPHLLIHEPGGRGAAMIRDGESGPEIVIRGEQAALGRRIADLLKREAKRDIEPLVLKHTTALGRRAKTIRFKDTSSRWGSCSSDGNLSFSWRIMMAPPLVIDYLVAHEVAHLKHMDHSPQFWAQCEALCPRMGEAKAWLKRNGGKLMGIGFG
jgi:predicted metal-dependent hydrolase